MNINVPAVELKSIMNKGVKLAQNWANFNGEFYLISKSCHVVVYQGIWDGLVMRNARRRTNSYRVLVGKPEGKRLLERRSRRCEDDIKKDLGEIGWEGVD
jgi:hypothetical protein